MSTIYQTVTDRIVAQIEAGAGSWRMPWHTTGGHALADLPRNVTGRAYRGINVPLLWGASLAAGYGSPLWATYKQWGERGAQVRKGEKATMIIFWKTDVAAMPGEGDGDDDKAERSRRRLIARAYMVFNQAQVDGYDDKPAPAPLEGLSEAERVDGAEAFFARCGAVVAHGGDRACYIPSADIIRMPAFAQFRDAFGYYSTLAHEHVHWSGAKPRLDRDLNNRFGSDAYAIEELIAELGAAFVCATLGLSNEPRPDHAAYLDSWLRCLKSDARAIFTVASRAQAAADYLEALQTAEAKAAA